jgi:hypothetical protein
VLGYALGESRRFRLSAPGGVACVVIAFLVLSGGLGWTYLEARKARPLIAEVPNPG